MAGDRDRLSSPTSNKSRSKSPPTVGDLLLVILVGSVEIEDDLLDLLDFPLLLFLEEEVEGDEENPSFSFGYPDASERHKGDKDPSVGLVGSLGGSLYWLRDN